MSIYRSGFEERVAKSLEKRGIKFTYESISLPFTKPMRMTKKLKKLHNLPEDFTGYTYHFYTPDFILENGIVIEVKGRFTAAMRTIMLNVIRCNPHLEFRMTFQSDNKLHPGSKSRNSTWCNQHGIKFSIGKVPTSWAEE